jgi:hypothetical protein
VGTAAGLEAMQKRQLFAPMGTNPSSCSSLARNLFVTLSELSWLQITFAYRHKVIRECLLVKIAFYETTETKSCHIRV